MFPSSLPRRSVAGQSTRSSRSGAKAPDDPLAFLDDWNPRDAPGAPASVSTTRDDSSVQEQGSSRASKGTGSGMALPGVYGSVTGGRSPERARAPGGAGAPPPLAAEASQVSQASKASGTSRYSSLSNGTAGRVAGGNGRSPLRPGAPRAAPGRRRTLVGHKPTVFTSGQGRISRHLAAHDANNWMDRLVTNNYVASIIQAWFKGYRVRKEWKKDPKRLADRVHAQAMAEIAAERGVPLHTLERSYEEEEGPRAMDQNHYEHLKKMVQLKMTLGKRKDIYMSAWHLAFACAAFCVHDDGRRTCHASAGAVRGAPSRQLGALQCDVALPVQPLLCMVTVTERVAPALPLCVPAASAAAWQLQRYALHCVFLCSCIHAC